MEYILLIIPCLIFILLQRPRHRIGLFLIIPSTALLIFVVSTGVRYCNSLDTEYLSYHYVKIRHVDKWDEYISRTCTKTVIGSEGKEKTITYDCSYVETHPDYWILIDNAGNEIYTDKAEFDRIKKRWGTKEVFIDMHRDFYTIDGDAQEYGWPGTVLTCETYTTQHLYSNKVANSGSIFRDRAVDIKEARELGLFDYPDKKELNRPVLGDKLSETELQWVTWLNGYYGKSKQFHNFVLVYRGKSAEIAKTQEAYWQRGNKNELVTCIGLGKGRQINWVYCFSWQDGGKLEIELERWLMGKKTLDYKEYSLWLSKNLDKWTRKNFSEFDYIQVDMNLWQLFEILIIVLIFCGLYAFGYKKYIYR